MRRLFVLFTALLLLCGTITTIFAAQPNVVDSGGLLTSSEEAQLSQKIRKIVSEYSMDVVIVTVESLDGRYAQSYADDYFDYNCYGIGSDSSGILLLLSMEKQEWAVSTCGNAIRTVTNSEMMISWRIFWLTCLPDTITMPLILFLTM